jgi:hypothetical protein
MKYVIMYKDQGSFYRAYPLIFPEHMTHHTVAYGLMVGYMREEEILVEILSAGFCYGGEGKWVAKVGSESLKVPKQEEGAQVSQRDSRILNMVNAQQGIIYNFEPT